jgi:hypothetical protein
VEVDAFLADSVVAAEGKLFVQGGAWSTLAVQSLPARHPRIGIGIIIRVPYTETNSPHRQEIRLEDSDGRELSLTEGSSREGGSPARPATDFNIGRPAFLLPGEDQLIPIAMNLDGFVFERAGMYRFVISIDGKDVKSLPLRVHEASEGGSLRP